MKNIILAGLAILFIIIILFHFMEVQLEHFECTQSEQNDAISKLFYDRKISQLELNNIQNAIDLQGERTDDSIVQILHNLNITDPTLVGILKDMKTSSDEKIQKFKCALKNITKSEFDQELVIYFPLDKVKSNGTIENEAISQKLVPETDAYVGKLESLGNGAKPTLDGDDVRGLGLKSMKFTGTDTLNGGYISINKLPTFWDSTGQNFLGFSLAVWVKAEPNNHDWAKIFDFAVSESQMGSAAGYNNNIFCTVTNTHTADKGSLAFFTTNGTFQNKDTVNSLTYSGVVVDGIWRHYVFTITPSNSEGTINYKIYIDGVLMNSNYTNAAINDSGKIETISNTLDPKRTDPPNNKIRKSNFIGRSNFNIDSFFNGKMADFRIYTKELSSDTIKRLYDYLTPKLDSETLFNSSSLAKANGAISNIPGVSNGVAPKINFHLYGHDSFIPKNTKTLTWLDHSGMNNNAVASNSSVKFCPITNKITIPSGSYMDIDLKSDSNYGAPFTLFIVADVKSFNPQVVKGSGNMQCNHIFASPDFDGFELAFTENHVVCYVLGRSAITSPLNMVGANGNGINIYTVQCDADGKVTFYINSSPVMIQQKFPNGFIPQNRKIRLACAYGPDMYPSSDNIDYYQVAHISGILNPDFINMAEAWMAKTWNIQSKLSSENTYLYP